MKSLDNWWYDEATASPLEGNYQFSLVTDLDDNRSRNGVEREEQSGGRMVEQIIIIYILYAEVRKGKVSDGDLWRVAKDKVRYDFGSSDRYRVPFQPPDNYWRQQSPHHHPHYILMFRKISLQVLQLGNLNDCFSNIYHIGKLNKKII